MTPSKVYFTSFKSVARENMLKKLHRLMKAAGFESIDFTDKFTAIKVHFGEYGNLAFLRPNYSKVVADYVKELGGKPFLTDCNTLYVGSRKNALDHLDTAYLNGFSPLSTGCHVIIADGIKGNDETLVPVDGKYVKEAKIGHAIMDADVFISLSHFKGHEIAGFGGALKNIGMGCGSRAGKMEMHCEGKPDVNPSRCIGCGACAKICAHGGPVMQKDHTMFIDHSKCAGCGRCIAICPKDAIAAPFDNPSEILNCRIDEYAKAVVSGRPCFHIALICDVSPDCDCHSENDIPVIPDIGMLASFDPVALDRCCVDLCMKAPIVPTSVIGEHGSHSHDKHSDCCHGHEGESGGSDPFTLTHPDTEWQSGLKYAEEIGLGTNSYEMITV